MLSEAELPELRRLRVEGVSQRELAARFGVSQSSVSKLTRVEGVPVEDGRVRAELDAWLEKVELSKPDRVRARVAEALASKIDLCSASALASAATALPKLASAFEMQVGLLASADDRPALDVPRLLREVQAQ